MASSRRETRIEEVGNNRLIALLAFLDYNNSKYIGLRATPTAYIKS
jgi:hypothetical protein